MYYGQLFHYSEWSIYEHYWLMWTIMINKDDDKEKHE